MDFDLERFGWSLAFSLRGGNTQRRGRSFVPESMPWSLRITSFDDPMTEPQPAEAANEEERKRRRANVESASKAPANKNELKAQKDEARSGLRSQGEVDIVPADKPAFVRVYNKAPNLERRFDAVDMDEKTDKDDPIPPVTGPVIKPTEAEKTKMPADEPPATPAPQPKPGQRSDTGPGKSAPDATEKEAKDVEKVTPSKAKDAEATDSDEESA